MKNKFNKIILEEKIKEIKATSSVHDVHDLMEIITIPKSSVGNMARLLGYITELQVADVTLKHPDLTLGLKVINIIMY